MQKLVKMGAARAFDDRLNIKPLCAACYYFKVNEAHNEDWCAGWELPRGGMGATVAKQQGEFIWGVIAHYFFSSDFN